MVGLSNNGKPQLDDWPDPGPQEVHAAARHILGCDLSVIRVMADGSKMPAGAWKQYQETKPSLDDLARWFGSGAAYAIGIPCGKASGNLEVIDVEGTDVCDVYLELIKTHDPELYARLVIIETPSGGKHLLFRCEKIEGNQKLAMRAVEVPEGTDGAWQEGDRWFKLKTLIETRGQGGQIVAPGSPLSAHPTRKPYRFIQGSFETIPTITQAKRELLLGLARALNEYHPKEEKREKTEYKQVDREAGEDLRAGDDYNLRGDPLPDLLDGGWTIERRHGPIIYLRKPGAKGRGHHATLHAVAPNVFYNFSTSVAPFDSDRGYKPFQVRALLKHNGDFKAAAKELAAQGYGKSKPAATNTAKSNGKKPTKPALEAAALIDDAILLMLNHFPEFTEENKITLLALVAVFGGRKTADVAHGLLASRIKQREGTEAGRRADAQFGLRRLTKLKKALRRSIDYPVLTVKLHSKSQPKTKNGNYKPSKYELDMKPFLEVLGLAEKIYKEWCAGEPRLKEWINPETKEPYTPNQGKCRELAAKLKADQYRKNAKEVQKEEEASNPKKDRFTKEVDALHALLRDVKKLADTWDEKPLCEEDRLIDCEKVVRHVREILLHENRNERDRILRNLLGLKPRKRRRPSIMGDIRLSGVVDDGVDVVDSRVSGSFIVNAQKTSYDRQLSQWRALGVISENLPRPIIWHNKDHDDPYTAIGIFDNPGPDGRLYVKTQESKGGLPFDELEFLPEVAATTGDPLVDALLADEMEALAEWKQPRL